MKRLLWLAIFLLMTMAWSFVIAEALEDNTLVGQARSASHGLQNDQRLASGDLSLDFENPHYPGNAGDQRLLSNAARESLTDQDKNRLESSFLYVAYRLLLPLPDPILLLTEHAANYLF